MKVGQYTYQVFWSEEDQEFVGTCNEFPSLSWLGDTSEKALEGITNLVEGVIQDLHTESAILGAVTRMLEERLSSMQEMPEFSKHLEAKLHLDQGTPERAYWRHGYVAAMQDTLKMIQDRHTEYPIVMAGVELSTEE